MSSFVIQKREGQAGIFSKEGDSKTGSPGGQVRPAVGQHRRYGGEAHAQTEPEGALSPALQTRMDQVFESVASKQAKARGGTQAPLQMKEVSQGELGLPGPLKNAIEHMSGLAMDDVRVHYNSQRPAQLRARAFTQGNHIHMGPGQERHLAHEAWHVVQQRQGRVLPTNNLGGAPINDDPRLEYEADHMGAQAAKRGRLGDATVLNAVESRPAMQAKADVSWDSPWQAKGALTLKSSWAAQAQPVIQGYDLKPGPFADVVEAMKKNQAINALINKALEGGDITIVKNSDDDTFWNRNSRTIQVSSKKNKNQAFAAILFELNNAVNPHSFTNAIEARMVELSKKGEKLTGPDYFLIAQEMEKDEFESLKDYKTQVEAGQYGGQLKSVLMEKYGDLLNLDEALDYEKFVAQNFSSGHTRELAELQYAAYTQEDPSGLSELLPFHLKHPTEFQRYNEGQVGSRRKEKIREILEKEKELGLDAYTEELFEDPKLKDEVLEDEILEDLEDEQVGLTFEQWMRQISLLFDQEYGDTDQTMGDSDAPFRDGYDDQMPPAEFYEKYMSNWKYFF